MTTVTLLHIESGFANIPTRFVVVDDDYEDYEDDCHVYPVTYDLPDGYTIAMCTDHERRIFDSRGTYCDIVEHSCGRPQLISASRHMPVLARVGTAQQT